MVFCRFLYMKLALANYELSFSMKRVKTIGYFLGTALTVTGLIQQDQDPDTPNKELKSGIIILLSTYIFDHVF